MIGYSGESEPSESPGQFTLREVMIMMMIVTSMIMIVIVILMIMMMIAILMIMM